MAQFELKKFNVNNNICIEASAGTGKTYTVQQIVAELLRLKPARSLENILIVTYTDKATGELRDRIRTKIQEELAELKKIKRSGTPEKKSAEDEEKYLSLDEQIENFEKQMAVVDNAPIYTIHSFCQKTLSEFGFDARQCDDLKMLDEEAAAEFTEKWLRDKMAYDDIYVRFKLKKSEEDSEINLGAYVKALKKFYLNSEFKEEPSIIALDKTIPEDKIKEIKQFTAAEMEEMNRLVKSENYESKYPGCYFNPKKIATIRKYVEKINDKNIKAEVNVSEEDDEEAFKKYKTNVSNTNDLLIAIKNTNPSAKTKQDAYESAKRKLPKLLDEVIISGYAIRESAHTANFPGEVEKYFSKTKEKENYNNFKDLCSYFNELKKSIETLGKRNKEDFEPLKTLIFEQQIPELYKEWIKYKAENKCQDFDDMIRNVREAVCRPDSELLKKLKEKYQYAIIDEFQDTNQKQWDIFKRVFMDYDDNSKTCRKDENHAICVVGDPKQSIYAFQGADVNVYTSALEDIKNSNNDLVKAELPYRLERNFRSTNSIIDVCNALFRKTDSSEFFKGNNFIFEDSLHPDDEAQAGDGKNLKMKKLVKPDLQFDGKPAASFWTSEGIFTTDGDGNKKVSEELFAGFAAEQIIECCTFNDSGRTRLQVYKKNVKDAEGNFVLTNVSFSDFAVLCKSKPEMEELKRTFAACGIPYNHYKEANLFSGKECLDWIALFKAISAEDFSAGNRKILSECLYSTFFGKSMEELESTVYDLPDCPDRLILMQWKKLAEERKWAVLQEQIFEKSQVEERLSKLDKLTSLTKLRQLGDYCVEYLYKNNCSLEELTDHLTLVSKSKDEADEDDGNLVEKGTDFNAVQIMTVHASKGLEFPVVIAAAGVKNAPKNMDGFRTYHDGDSKLHINYDGEFKINSKKVSELANKESKLEWMRIFYVAYTRAASLMILPWYVNDNSTYDFLNTAFEKSEANSEKFLRKIEFSSFDPAEAKKSVKKILEKTAAPETDSNAEENRKKELTEFSSKLRKLETHKLSYTNLSHGKKTEKYVNPDNPEIDRNGDVHSGEDNSRFDEKAKVIQCSYDSENLTEINANYPRGSLLGEAVHETFEMAEFNRIGNLSAAEAEADTGLNILIRSKFKGQGFKIDEEDSRNIVSQTCKIVWDTLNSSLPEICGNNCTGTRFALKELLDSEHSAELEFNLNPLIPHNAEGLREYFNGFIDVLFVRTTAGGKKVYSVLDWKTDSMEKASYADGEVLKQNTDTKYAIQRVLYSYCLIKWLKQFAPENSESEIFEQQFGGIYYVYVRGTKAGTENGIYAQTWNSWDDLKAAFDRIVQEKLPEEK